MKKLFYMVLVVVSMGFAGKLNIYSQSYNFEEIVGGYNINPQENSWLCDDFILEENNVISSISVWASFYGEQSYEMAIVILEDMNSEYDPNESYVIWEETITHTMVSTGDYWLGLAIFEFQCNIPEEIRPNLNGGTHYYIGLQFNGDNLNYILTSDNYIGDTCWYRQNDKFWVKTSNLLFGESTDLFIEMYSELTSLHLVTWAGIKNSCGIY